jgi:collagen beta-1,O-galactosyltransferase
MKKDILIVILCRNKEKTLPLFLDCILNQSYPKEKLHLYIRSNNNTDSSLQILNNWIDLYGKLYNSIFYDFSDIEVDFPSEEKHKILSSIKNDSISYAKKKKLDCFMVDLDVYIKNFTLEYLNNINLNIIAPFLKVKNSSFSNYHSSITENGYFSDNDPHIYFTIQEQKIKGILELNVVSHCYLLKNKILKYVNYIDDTNDRPYIIFSRNLRNNKIIQYLDNRYCYGYFDITNSEPVIVEDLLK